jgi:hypothetical protein
VRKSDLLAQIDQLQQLLSTQSAEQRLLIAQLNQRIEEQRRRSQELELRLQQRIASLEEAFSVQLSLLVEARERQQAAVAQLHHAVQMHKHELQAIEDVLDAA